MQTIYLDYAADTPPDAAVIQDYTQAAQNCFGNPNSLHPEGARSKDLMNRSLQSIAELLHVQPDELILTSGASEANNLAVKGAAYASRRKGKHIISTFLEHSSVSGALTYLQEQGWEIDIVQLDADGRVDVQHLASLLREDTVLCSVCAVDSELGIVQPVQKIAALLKEYPNCRFHVDATQAVGKIPLDLTGFDLVSFAPHKFYGLKGCGVLVKRKGVILEPLIHGGASTTLYRSGTPDAPAAAACAKALELALQEFPERSAVVQKLNAELRTEFMKLPNIRINSPDHAVPFILNLSVNGIKGEEIRKRLAERGVCVSVKSACSVPNTPSRAVMALTHDRKNALSSWRISLSHLATQAELETFLHILAECM